MRKPATRFRLLRFGIAALTTGLASAAGLPAFPGAEGFGAEATGGRGGAVYHVTTLADAGPGSFRDAVASGGRTVVLDVAGVIKIRSEIAVASNLTIAGESAPGGGITIYGQGVSFSNQSNVIVRYLRFRGSSAMSRGAKTVNISSGTNIILDHCTISWGRWDNLGLTTAGKHPRAQPASTNITIQDCLISEAILPQQFGCLVNLAHGVTFARNLWVDLASRNPKGEGNLQYFNNVVYNYGHGGYVGSHSTGGLWKQDLVGNYFIAGPSSVNGGRGFLSEFSGGRGKGDLVYQSGNLADLDRDGKLNGHAVVAAELLPAPATKKRAASLPTFASAAQNHPPIPVRLLPAAAAFTIVTRQAGASLGRDSIDTRLVADVLSLGTHGALIGTEADAGGINVIPPTAAPPDTDADGLPDAYETAHGLNPHDPHDSSALTPGGYTQLELYLHTRTAPPP